MLDGAAAIALLLQATEAYRFLGFLSPFSSQTISILFTAFFALYLAARWRTFAAFINRPLGQAWIAATCVVLILSLGLQVLAGGMATDRALYWGAFSLLFMLILMTAYVLWARKGPSMTMPFFVSAIAVTWLGFAVNLLNYGLIREVMSYTSNRIAQSDYLSRVLGFYPHPNMAGLALTLFLACLVTDQRFLRSSVFTHATVLSSVIAGVALTGSRTSLLLLTLVIAWYLIALMRAPGASASSVVRAFFAPIAILAAVCAGVVVLVTVVGPSSQIYESVLARAGSLVGGNIEDDMSISARVAIFDVYMTCLLYTSDAADE